MGCGFAGLGRRIGIVSALLHGPQRGVTAGLCQQGGVVAAFNDASAFEHQDLVGADHGRQPVRDDQGGAALRGLVERTAPASLPRAVFAP